MTWYDPYFAGVGVNTPLPEDPPEEIVSVVYIGAMIPSSQEELEADEPIFIERTPSDAQR